MNINIFQYLKQGTSLNRQSIKKNKQLEEKMIPQARTTNTCFEETGKFNPSDSQESSQLQTLDQQQLQHQQNVKKQRIAKKRKQLGIKVTGVDVPEPIYNFTKLIHKYQLSEPLTTGLADLGFSKPTPVQTEVLPSLLQKRNTLVTAPTGTGKTLSFLLPIAQHIPKASARLQAVIITPIQELAQQIFNELSILTSKTDITSSLITQLTPQQQEKIQNNKQPNMNILVITPLSFLNMFQEHVKLLKHVKFLVLDECDKYFQDSFLEQIQSILALFTQYHPVYGLFSATIQHPVEELLKTELLDDCVRVEIGGKNRVLEKISQSMEYCTNEYGKLVQVRNMIVEGQFVPPVLIFVQEKQRAKQLYYELKKILKQGVNLSKKLQVLTSDKDKSTRQRIIQQFDEGEFWILITTDLVARGIDFRNVNLVINYDFPNSILTYIHRVGRTGRAQRNGTAVTLYTDQDKPMLRSLGNLLKVSGCSVPEWICQLPKANKKLRKKLEKHPVKRVPVGKTSSIDKDWQKQVEKREKYELKRNKKNKQKEEQSEWIQVHEQ